jgi:hypothetical protein
VDGFGSFLNIVNATGNDITSPVSFQIDKVVLDFPKNGSPNNAEFAVHVQFNGSCSGYVSDGAHSGNLSQLETGCTTNSELPKVPEPTTMFLVGSLLSGLGVLGRKKFLSIVKD